MKFFEKVIQIKEGNDNLITSNNTEFLCHYDKERKYGYLHILYNKICDTQLSYFNKFLEKYNFKIDHDYIKFLETHNGCILYAGAVNFFGITTKFESDDMCEPSDLVKYNEDILNSRLDENLLCIGNLLAEKGTNVDIFYDFDDCNYYRIKDNKIIKKFNALSKMLDEIINLYDKNYNKNGLHKDYDNKNKKVYKNIQLY